MLPGASLIPGTLKGSLVAASINCDLFGVGDRLLASVALAFSKIVGWLVSAADGRFLE